MGIRSKLGVYSGIGNGAFAVISGVLKRVASIRLPNLRECLSVDMLKSEYLPYEASQTYRKIMIEFDHTRTSAVVETRRQLWSN